MNASPPPDRSFRTVHALTEGGRVHAAYFDRAQAEAARSPAMQVDTRTIDPAVYRRSALSKLDGVQRLLLVEGRDSGRTGLARVYCVVSRRPDLPGEEVDGWRIAFASFEETKAIERRSPGEQVLSAEIDVAAATIEASLALDPIEALCLIETKAPAAASGSAGRVPARPVRAPGSATSDAGDRFIPLAERSQAVAPAAAIPA